MSITHSALRSLSPTSMDSPKRKHRELADADDMLDRSVRLQSPLLAEEHIYQSGRDSPRSMVAQRFESMDIRREHDHSGSPSPRKRARFEHTSLFETAGKNSNQQSSPTIDTTMKVTKRLNQRERSLSPDAKQSNAGASSPTHESGRRYRSPPPPPYAATSIETGDVSVNNLTWQISEITGMDIDVQAGDDGEGLNGIGFRPTAQIAHARRQKRKQQLSEWRTREARDARQKRFEKRHGCKLHDAGGGNQERSVRFAEML